MFYYVKNLQGDIVKILDEDGNEKASCVYNAWGDILSQSNDELSSINPLRYRGYVYDEDTTMYYLQTRYYATTGRFINADDTAFIGSSGTAIGDNIYTYCENDPVNNVDYTGQWYTNYHKYISEKEGFSSSKYKTVRNWVYNADVYPCESTEYYSAPFHARDNGLDIACKLYNFALKIKKTKRCMKFTIGEPKKGYYSINFLKYEAKKYENVKRTKETLEAQNNFLKTINVKNWNKQSQMLLGLALHTFQDYFAHVVKVTLYKSKNNYYLFDGCTGLRSDSLKMCNVDDSKYMNLNNKIEDNPSIFPWRINTARGVTSSVYKAWTKSRPIKCSYRVSYSGSDLYYYRRTTGILCWKTYWTIQSYKYYVSVKY